jgi:hypothetical protein
MVLSLDLFGNFGDIGKSVGNGSIDLSENDLLVLLANSFRL